MRTRSFQRMRGMASLEAVMLTALMLPIGVFCFRLGAIACANFYEMISLAVGWIIL